MNRTVYLYRETNLGKVEVYDPFPTYDVLPPKPVTKNTPI
jgi:hypothetical protein